MDVDVRDRLLDGSATVGSQPASMNPLKPQTIGRSCEQASAAEMAC
jgi:hypothetical protein